MEKHIIKRKNGENSYIKITGEVEQELCYSHTSFGERFYEAPVEVKRFSGNIDKVLVMLPERFCSQLKAGSLIGIRRQLRTHSKDVGNYRKVLLRIFAREVWLEFPQFYPQQPNSIGLAINNFQKMPKI